MTTETESLIEETAAPAESISLPHYPMAWQHDKITPDKRASAKDREPLEAAKLASEKARARVEQLRHDLIGRQTRIEALTSKRDRLTDRLSRLEKRDLAKQKAECMSLVERLLDSAEAEEHPRAMEINSAVHALAWIPALEKLLPGIIKNVKAELATAEKELAAVESEK